MTRTIIVFFCLIPSICWASPSTEEKIRVGIFPIQFSFEEVVKQKKINVLFQKAFEANPKTVLKSFYPFWGSQRRKSKKQPVLLPSENANKAWYQSKIQLCLEHLQKGAFLKITELMPSILSQTTSHVANLELSDWLVRLYSIATLANLQLGRNTRAEYLLQSIATLAPTQLPKEIAQHRSVLFRYQYVRKSLTTQNNLQIEGLTGARVYLNGRFQGTIPLSIPNLANGKHYLFVKRQDHFFQGREVLLEGTPVKESFRLKPIPKEEEDILEQLYKKISTQISLQTLNAEENHLLIESACKSLPVDFIFSGFLKKSIEKGYLFSPIKMDCRKKTTEYMTTREVSEDFSQLEDLRDKVMEEWLPFAKKRILPLQQIPLKVAPPSSSKAWIWVVTGLGIAAIGGGITAAVVLTQSPKIRVQVKWNTNP